MSCHATSCHVMPRHATSCTSCQVMPRHATSCTPCHVMPRHVTSCHLMSRNVTSCQVMSRHVMSCYVMSRLATTCHVMPRHVIVTSCHVMSRHVTPWHVMSRRKSRDGHTTNASLSTDFFHTQLIQIRHNRVRWLSRRVPIPYCISGVWSSSNGFCNMLTGRTQAVKANVCLCTFMLSSSTFNFIIMLCYFMLLVQLLIRLSSCLMKGNLLEVELMSFNIDDDWILFYRTRYALPMQELVSYTLFGTQIFIIKILCLSTLKEMWIRTWRCEYSVWYLISASRSAQ